MVKYDVNRYQEACDKVRKAAIKIKDLPGNNEELKSLVREAVQGTLEACLEIYDPEPIKSLGSESDYETDKKGLKDLVKYFEKP